MPRNGRGFTGDSKLEPKRRGRPPKRPGNDAIASVIIAGNDGGNVVGVDEHALIIDPASVEPAGGSGDGGSGGPADPRPSDDKPRKRGRPAGSGARKAAKNPVNVSGIEKLLLSTHGLLAHVAKTPELALDEAEASALAVAIADVSQHYDVLSRVSAEGVAWVNLMQAIGMVYGPRVIAYKMRKTAEKREPEPARPFSIVQ